MDSLLSSSKPTVVEEQERKNYDFPPKNLYINRYCNQDDFSVLICGGYDDDKLKNTHILDGPKLDCKKYTNPESLCYCKTAVLNSDYRCGYEQYYAYDSCGKKFCDESKIFNFCEKLSKIDDNYCLVCAFKQNIYIFTYDYGPSLVYNYETNKLTQIADMSINASCSACAVFEGKIVVSGGYSKSVEAYDYYENKWNYLPNMNEERESHASVSMGNKLFVIGGHLNTSAEVFDSLSKIFTSFHSALLKTIIPYNSKAVCVGNKIIVFCRKYSGSTLYVYDVINDSWSKKKIEVVNNLVDSSYIKYNSD